MKLSPLLLALLASACGPSADDHRPPANAITSDVPVNAVDSAAIAPPPVPTPTPIAVNRTLAEWRKADNRVTCAPLALTDDGGAKADPRAASFSGGWAVAFDQPGRRSAYGVAGTGVAVGAFEEEAAKLRAQWPLTQLLGGKPGNLPQGALAAYGVEGAAAYPESNPDGEGLNSLAYVLVPGQRCLYNVWSKLGRQHLERLLDGLTILPPA